MVGPLRPGRDPLLALVDAPHAAYSRAGLSWVDEEYAILLAHQRGNRPPGDRILWAIAGFKLSYESVIMAKTAALGLVFA